MTGPECRHLPGTNTRWGPSPTPAGDLPQEQAVVVKQQDKQGGASGGQAFANLSTSSHLFIYSLFIFLSRAPWQAFSESTLI